MTCRSHIFHRFILGAFPVISSIVFPSISLAGGAVAGANYIDPVYESPEVPNHLEQEQGDKHFTTWASDHRSFPQVDSETSSDLTCFMKTEDGRTLNLEKICGNSSEAPLTQPEETN